MVALAKAHRKSHTPCRPAQYSGLRYYSPEISRWLSRDPIGERGLFFPTASPAKAPFLGVTHLYVFLANEPLGSLDLLGAAEVRYSLDVRTGVETIRTSRTVPDQMAVVCSCTPQPGTSMRCPCQHTMSCAVLSSVQVLIVDEEQLSALNRTFEQAFVHEMRHVGALFWFAEECARHIEDGGFERRCYNTFFSCRRTVETIEQWWERQLADFRHNQAIHALDPAYGNRPPVGPHDWPWDSYGPRGPAGRHLITEAIAHHLP